MKVLFVCLGNICRSPLAEAVFTHKIQKLNLQFTISADSCGTGAYHIGEQPDPRTIKTAENNGVAIWHQARQLSPTDLTDFDYLFAMDEQNLNGILRLAGATQHKHKIKLMREFDPHGPGDVPDPYYGTMHDFQHVFQMLDRTLDVFIESIK
ncbi:MAG TPA: low molecular weight protein-tyrosine-phosphatase [Cyclobacteriaceae bacterium]|jgi:protein-tyrosine phosphatase|nr:low molecular weight phosphotyrosine protein phosphatase [Cytophagales bacterium]HMR57402.1 low molecular weight protein-tyrosine-phosphatase [Cyclobacteriaceae bacterium]HRE67325.1 low molecular weight protein-tyrosine-phosphatase [Cyclobacteriaceae bacterium]HRF33067.1 low molecular weight protein-tyrosine-phosphatase [Cyclobacteriaceae bacterium]